MANDVTSSSAEPVSVAVTLFEIRSLVGGRGSDEIAEHCARSVRTIQRWIANGVTWEQADVFAARFLGVHPLTVFGPGWHDAAEGRADVPDELAKQRKASGSA